MKGKIVRLFISSTFSDFKAERNALRDHVFPRLKKLCDSYGAKFHPIDLRWGVRKKDALSQQTLKICLNEIKRCQTLSLKPNLLIFLGNRFGWQTVPAEIPTSEWDQIIGLATEIEKQKLKYWYMLDKNANPPSYILNNREENDFDNHSWESEERGLRSIFRSIIPKLNWPVDDKRKRKYFSSATQQEIYEGALDTNYTSEHIACVFRSINNLPSGKEIEKAKDYVDVDEQQTSIDYYAQAQLADLRTEIEERFPESIIHYRTDWMGESISYDYLNYFIEDVYQKMYITIKNQLEAMDPSEFIKDEKKEHAKFSKKQVLHFTGRQAELNKINNYLNSKSSFPLLVHGLPGSGKSALIARASEEALGSANHKVIIRRFVGATSLAFQAETILKVICQELDDTFQQPSKLNAKNLDQWIKELRQRLQMYSEIKPIVIFLDALNQLSQPTHAITLVKSLSQLPSQVHVVLSCTTDFLSQVQSFIPEDLCYRLNKMSDYEAQIVLDQWLSHANRTLQPKQQAYVLKQFKKSPYPLYLRLAFDQAKEWKSWEIKSVRPSIRGIIEDRLEYLEDHHGKSLTSSFLSFIALSRYGLTEEEIYGLISEDRIIMEEYKRNSPDSPQFKVLPMVIYSRFYSDLEAYMTGYQDRESNLLKFYHNEFYQVVKMRYNLEDQKKLYHQKMEVYFRNLPLTNSYRKVVEQPYQQIHANEWEQLEKNTLGNLSFLLEKVKQGLVLDLRLDFQLAFSFTSMPQKTRQLLQIWDEFLQQEIHVLTKYPRLAFQQAANSSNRNIRDFTNKHVLDQQQSTWLQLINKKRKTPGLVQQFLEDPSYFINGYGAYFFSDYVIGAGGSNVKIWDANTGELLHVLDEPWEAVYTFTISNEGKRCVTEHRNHYVLWDLERFIKINGELAIKLSHLKTMNFSKNGKLLAIVEAKRTLIFETKTGKLIKELPNDNQIEIEEMSWSSDGKYLAFITNTQEIVIWNLKTGISSTLENSKENNNKYRIYKCDWLEGSHVVILCSIWGYVYCWKMNQNPIPLFSTGTRFGVKVRKIHTITNQQILFIYDIGTVFKYDLLNVYGEVVIEKEAKMHYYQYALSTNGKWLALADGQHLELWNLFCQEKKALLKLDSPLTSINWNEDNSRFITADNFGIIKLWELGELQGNYTKNSVPIKSINSHTKNDKVLTVHNGQIQEWNKVNGKVNNLYPINQEVYNTAISSKGQIALALDNDKILIPSQGQIDPQVGSIKNLSWSVDEDKLAIIGLHKVCFYNALTKEKNVIQVIHNQYEKIELESYNRDLVVNINNLHGDLYSKNNQLIHSERGLISIFPEHKNYRYVETFDCNNHVVVGSRNGVNILWDRVDATENLAEGHDLICSASSPCGRWITLLNKQKKAKEKKRVKIILGVPPELTMILQTWDTKERKEINKVIISSTGLINDGKYPGSAFMFFIEDIPYLVYTENAISREPKTEVWNGKTGQLAGHLLGRISDLSQISSDLKMVVSIDQNLFRLFSMDTWTEIASFPAYSIQSHISWATDNQTICLGYNGYQPVFVRITK